MTGYLRNIIARYKGEGNFAAPRIRSVYEEGNRYFGELSHSRSITESDHMIDREGESGSISSFNEEVENTFADNPSTRLDSNSERIQYPKTESDSIKQVPTQRADNKEGTEIPANDQEKISKQNITIDRNEPENIEKEEDIVSARFNPEVKLKAEEQPEIEKHTAIEEQKNPLSNHGMKPLTDLFLPGHENSYSGSDDLRSGDSIKVPSSDQSMIERNSVNHESSNDFNNHTKLSKKDSARETSQIIRVNIGQIVVKAVREEKTVSDQTVKAYQPKISLHEYLENRKGSIR